MLNDEQLQAFIQGRLRPDEAARFAAEIEASDELQQRLAKLSVDKNTEDLRHAGRSELEPPVPTDIAQTADYDSDKSPSSLTIGPYKLLKLVGSGGMGEVWLAEQSSPIKRRVAIKMIKAGMDSKQIVARFEAERQALALMDHPNIAKVFDAGIAENGRPFVVMEYVKGIPLTDYCDQARLPLKERLQLFVPICAAVQHAHQKGIIHRDLKPSNILV